MSSDRILDRTTTPSPANSRDDWAIVRRFARDYLTKRWPTLLLALICMLFAAGATAGLAALLGPVVKKIFIQKNLHMLVFLSAMTVVVVTVRAVATFLQDAIMTSTAESVIADVQHDMFKSQVNLDIAALNNTHSSELVSKFLYDATLLRGSITTGVSTIGMQFMTAVGLIAVMLYQDWQLALISVLLLPPVGWVTRTLGRSLKKSSTRSMEATGDLARSLSEALSGRRIVKAYGLENFAVAAADARIQQRLKFILRAVRARAAAAPSTDLIGGFAVALTIAFAGYQTVHGSLTVDKFAAFIGALIFAQQPVRQLSQFWTISNEGLSAASRIFGLIDSKPAIVDRPGAIPLVVTPAPKGGAITFKDVVFAYHDGTPALDHVSLEIPPGKKIALVGPSGAGKSTIFNLLLRFYDADSGTIAIDGQDIRGVTQASLRSAIALVTQESILFDESVADNIGLGRQGAGRQAIIDAAANAAADGFIRELPQGYDTRVGEGALKLSGGQRQRLAIARAMVRDAPILLLDEATSALDNESERQVQEALSRLMKGKTTIVIAHRLSTVLDADRIYVLDRGRVMESGTHGELLARKGLYARLYQHDFRDDEREDEPMAVGA